MDKAGNTLQCDWHPYEFDVRVIIITSWFCMVCRDPLIRTGTTRCSMPIYEYTCRDCKYDFVVVLSIKELETKPAVACPGCKSGNVEKKYSGFTAVTAKKS